MVLPRPSAKHTSCSRAGAAGGGALYARAVAPDGDEGAIERAAAAARSATGMVPDAVLPAIVSTDRRVFVCALGGGEERLWLVVGDDGAPVADAGVIRDAVEIVAISEIAEEAVSLLVLEESRPLVRRTLELADGLGETSVVVAARATLEALDALAEVAPPGVRVASAVHLDAVAAAAVLVGDRFDLIREAALEVSARLSGEPGDPRDELARTIWDAVRVLARDGSPDRFREAVENGMVAASALADDVLAHYAVPVG
jgi:hypothetical protein